MINELDIAGIVKAYYDSYPARDRKMIEGLVSDDFCFTSPLDNRIDRRTYFDRCWPNGEDMKAIDIKRQDMGGDRAYVTYEITSKDGTVAQHRVIDLARRQNHRCRSLFWVVDSARSTVRRFPAGQRQSDRL